MKFNNKILSLIFLGLLAIYLFQKFVSKPEVRSFKEELVNVDTSSVDKIVFFPKGGSEKITFERFSSSWKTKSSNKEFIASSSSINSMLAPALSIKSLQLVSKNPEKWSNYEVDDIAGKKIELYSKGKLLSSYYVGRFNFNQNTRSAKTYIRLDNEDDIYVVDGFLSMTYEKQLDDFRNKQLVNGLSKNQINSVLVKSPEFNNILSKDLNNQWSDNSGSTIDSLSVSNFIGTLANLRGNDVIDSNVTAKEFAELHISGESMDQKHVITIFSDADNSFLFKSSTNDDVYFKSDSSGLFKSAYLDFKNLVTQE